MSFAEQFKKSRETPLVSRLVGATITLVLIIQEKSLEKPQGTVSSKGMLVLRQFSPTI